MPFILLIQNVTVTLFVELFDDILSASSVCAKSFSVHNSRVYLRLENALVYLKCRISPVSGQGFPSEVLLESFSEDLASFRFLRTTGGGAAEADDHHQVRFCSW